MAGMQTRRNREPNRNSDYVYSDIKTGVFERGAVGPSGGRRGRGRTKGNVCTRGESQGKNVATAATSDARGDRDTSSMDVLSGGITGGISNQDALQVLGLLSEEVEDLVECNKSTKEALKILFEVLNEDQVREIVNRNNIANDRFVSECFAQAVTGVTMRKLAREEGEGMLYVSGWENGCVITKDDGKAKVENKKMYSTAVSKGNRKITSVGGAADDT